MSDADDPIRVEVFSDVACPWCFIGKRNLDTAVDAFAQEHPGTPVEVKYRSFELQPNAPVSYDGSITEYLAETRSMNSEQAAAMLERPRQAARQVGIEIDFEALRPAATGQAHELLHLAGEHGKQAELGEALFRANFEQGRSLGDRDELIAIAAEAGLDRQEAIDALKDGSYLEGVEEDKESARELGIGGVPFFVIAERFGIAGAQPPEALLQALVQVLAERQAAA